MKKTKFFSVIIISFLLMSFSVLNNHVDYFIVDSKQSQIEWIGEKVSGTHTGTILLSGGTVKNNHGSISGNFEFDMTSISNADIKNEKSKKKLEEHLKSTDFFDVANFPKATFVISSVTPNVESNSSGYSHIINGNLSIKNISNEISFKANLTMQSDKVTCSGTAIIDRSKFAINYASKTTFPDIGDKMIFDEFKLNFNIVAIKK